MLPDQLLEDRKVLVELSIIPVGGNGYASEQIDEILKLADEIGLFHDGSRNRTCIEGRWSDISPLIYACYERVQERSPQDYLTVSIR